MSVITFIHAADLHLDSPLRGLERYDGAPVKEIRGATRRALENLVQLAIDESAAFVLIAGDVYDGDWRDYNTGLFFNSCMVKLQGSGIPVFMVSGNHDAESQITRALRLSANVHQFSVTSPETVRLEELAIAIHGQGFASAAISTDLASSYPSPIPGYLNIGLLHTSVNGREGHAPYAPCTATALRSKGYDYWALGHVHSREVLSRDPWIVFSGNIQGRHARETGEKGCSVVTVTDGRITDVRFAPLDVLRWKSLIVPLQANAEPEDALDLVAARIRSEAEQDPERLLALRLTLAGRSRATNALLSAPEHWTSQIRARAIEAAGGRAWVEKVATVATAASDTPAPTTEALTGLLAVVRSMGADPDQVATLPALFKELRAKLPAEICRPDGPLPLEDPAYLAARMGDVEQILLQRLGTGEVAQ